MNQRTKIVVVGGGGHAKVLISILRKLGTFDLLGYTDVKDNGPILGVSFLGTDNVVKDLKKKHGSLSGIVGLGAVKVSDKRKQLWNMLIREGIDLPVIISKHALVGEEVTLGKGTVVFDGAIINSGTTIGVCGIINTNSTVEHDCRISDHVHIATGATVSGGVHIGENCFIGAGASVVQYITICPNCIVGAGAVVIRDILEPGIYVGNPARKVK